MEENGVWRTVGGRRIFIKEGQDLASAMKESGKFSNKQIEDKKENNEPKGFEESKVRDEEGKLIKLYHGSNENFENFEIDKARKSVLAYGKGAYFTQDKNLADKYGKNIKEVYLNLKNPFIVQTEEQLEKSVKFKLEALKKKTDLSNILKEKGYDGVISYEDIGSNKIAEAIAFYNEQIHIIKKD